MSRLIDADALMDAMYDNEFQTFCPLDEVSAVIDRAPTIDAEPVRHGEWVHTDKHLWHKKEDGEIDEWAWDADFHNGPICEVCGASVCVNCHPDYQELTCKKGYFYCSLCGEVSKDAHKKRCHECGAIMDGGKTDGQ